MRTWRSVIALGLFAGMIVSTRAVPAGQAGRRQGRSAVDPATVHPKAEEMLTEMIAGRRRNRPIPPPTKTYGSFSLDVAYKIQGLLARRLRFRLGPVAGYKVAYASKAAQEQFGIKAPASAPLFLLQRVPNGSVLPAGDFTQILIETEVAFTIGKRIREPIKNVEDLKPFVRYAHAAFDIGNNRFDSSQAKPVVADQVANGVSAHRFILGPAMDPNEVDVDKVTLKLAVDDKTVAESAATNVMGSPWNSLLWLANQVVERGEMLEAGHVIVTGTAAPAYKAKGAKLAGSYAGDCGALGKVTCTIH